MDARSSPNGTFTGVPVPLRPHATRKPAAYRPQQPGNLIQIGTVHLQTHDLASVQSALRAWEDRYNRHRPHQALTMQTPCAFVAAFARGHQSNICDPINLLTFGGFHEKMFERLERMRPNARMKLPECGFAPTPALERRKEDVPMVKMRQLQSNLLRGYCGATVHPNTLTHSGMTGSGAR